MIAISVISVLFFFRTVSAQDCSWNKDTEFPESYPPLLIDKDSWVSLKAVDSNGQRMVNVAEGKSIVVACSGTLIGNLNVETTEGVCTNGNLEIDGQSYDILDLACDSRIDDMTYHPDPAEPCGDGNAGIKAQIGFAVTGYNFYPIVDECFDDNLDLVLYTEHIIYGESVDASDGNPSRPSFHTDTFYDGYNPDDCYSTNNQDDYAESLGSTSYIDTSGSIYFSRGHMSPNADFLTEMEADATFYYSNAVPQWQPYNGINWAAVEGDVRNLASDGSYDLKVTTGPYGQLVINENGTPTDLYFCEDFNIHSIPTPESVWKVVYEPLSDRGIAIVTSNHPHQSTSPTAICPVIDCTTFYWMETLDVSDLDKGFTYCCTVQDLHVAIPNAPDYPTAGLLID